MIKDLIDAHGVRQLGYYVESIEDAAEAWHRLLSAGPFVDMGSTPPERCLYRGRKIALDSRCALGQVGGMQIELIESHTDVADPYQELGYYGLHHVCFWTDDLQATVQHLRDEKLEVAMDLTTKEGLEVFYFDARRELGHYLEVNPPLQQLADAIAAIHEKWAGDESLIGMDTVMKMMGQ